MLVTEKPIGRYIAYTYNQQIHKLQSIDNQKIGDLIDLIKVGVQRRSIEDIAVEFREKIFRLKFGLMKSVAAHQSGISVYLNNINQKIDHDIQSVPHRNLATAVSLFLDEKIFSTNNSKFNTDNLEIFLKNANGNTPDYRMLEWFTFHPAPKIQSLKAWIDSSLDLELGLIVADLILSKHIDFSENRIELLIQFLNSSLTKYGGYSMFTDFWQPDETDDSPLVNRMKILCATIEMDYKIYHKTTSKELQELLNA